LVKIFLIGNKMSHHMVKKHRWVGGILESTSHFFDSFEDAKAFVDGEDADTLKIFDANGQLLHEVNPATNTSLS
jgi:hypothetical protein